MQAGKQRQRERERERAPCLSVWMLSLLWRSQDTCLYPSLAIFAKKRTLSPQPKELKRQTSIPLPHPLPPHPYPPAPPPLPKKKKKQKERKRRRGLCSSSRPTPQEIKKGKQSKHSPTRHTKQENNLIQFNDFLMFPRRNFCCQKAKKSQQTTTTTTTTNKTKVNKQAEAAAATINPTHSNAVLSRQTLKSPDLLTL